MNTEEQINAIEIGIDQAKEKVNDMEALQRLTKNKDFIQIITEGYFEKEASRVVLMKALPSMVDDESQNFCNKSIDAIGVLRQHFSAVMQMGAAAERSITSDQVTREELLAEGV